MVWIGERQTETFEQASDQSPLACQGDPAARRSYGANTDRSLVEFFDRDLALKLGLYEVHLAQQVRNVLFDLRVRMRRQEDERDNAWVETKVIGYAQGPRRRHEVGLPPRAD